MLYQVTKNGKRNGRKTYSTLNTGLMVSGVRMNMDSLEATDRFVEGRLGF